MKLYKIKTTKAYRMDELGITWSDSFDPKSTIYYEQELIETIDVDDIATPFKLSIIEDDRLVAETADELLELDFETGKWKSFNL